MSRSDGQHCGGRVAGLLLVCTVLVLSACASLAPEPAAAPEQVMFESPLAEIDEGVRLDPGEEMWNGFGEAVDVRGDLLVIGANDWNTDGEGSAYVYRLSAAGGEWQEEAHLTPTDGMDWEQRQTSTAKRFGSAVAIGDGIIAIGAPGSDDSVGGAVYLFEQVGSEWMETAKLAPDGLIQGSAQADGGLLTNGRMRRRSFGALVALDGNTLAVGGDSATDSVRIFERNEQEWQEQATILIAQRSDRDLYMVSMALQGDSLALSAFYVLPRQEQDATLVGNVVVYVFERDGDAWEERLRYGPDGDEAEFVFLREVNIGASVALSRAAGRANRLAVGLQGFPDLSEVDLRQFPMWTGYPGPGEERPEIPGFPASARETGLVTVFEQAANGDWLQQATLIPSGADNAPRPGYAFSDNPRAMFDPANIADVVFPGHLFSEAPAITFFGATVDLDVNQLAVTSGYANTTYVFERQELDWLYRFKIRSNDGEMSEDYAQVATISGDTLLLGTPGEFGNSAHVFRLDREGHDD